jgi:hypothetical protein
VENNNNHRPWGRKGTLPYMLACTAKSRPGRTSPLITKREEGEGKESCPLPELGCLATYVGYVPCVSICLYQEWCPPHHNRIHVFMSVDFYIHFDSVLLRTMFFPFLLSSPISYASLPLSTIMLEDVVDPLRLCWYSRLFSPSNSLVPIYAMPSHVQSAPTCLDLSIASQLLPGSL